MSELYQDSAAILLFLGCLTQISGYAILTSMIKCHIILNKFLRQEGNNGSPMAVLTIANQGNFISQDRQRIFDFQEK